MDLVTKIISILGGIVGLISVIGVLTGWMNWQQGIKNDDPNKSENGQKAMLLGAVGTGVATMITAYVIAAINGLGI